MKVLKKEKVDKYIVYGVLQDVIELDDAEEIYIIVNLDYNNKTFSIEPIDKEYESIEQINIENDDILIDKNENNIYQNQKITNEYLTNEYFVLYKKLAITEPELVYNIFSEEYRNERFGNIDNFKKYVNENKNEILKINKIRANIVDVTDDEAIIMMVDSNCQRSKILPSEKAFSYKMKLDAIKRQGKRNDLSWYQGWRKVWLAYFSRRSESEVVIDVSKLIDVEEITYELDEGED